MENVPQILESSELEEIVDVAKALGFTVTWEKLCAADFGVPQLRWRAFIIGCRFANPAEVFSPKRTHYNPKIPAHSLFDLPIDNKKPWATVRDAIARQIGNAVPPLLAARIADCVYDLLSSQRNRHAAPDASVVQV